jgi:hypothetical protein
MMDPTSMDSRFIAPNPDLDLECLDFLEFFDFLD